MQTSWVPSAQARNGVRVHEPGRVKYLLFLPADDGQEDSTAGGGETSMENNSRRVPDRKVSKGYVNRRMCPRVTVLACARMQRAERFPWQPRTAKLLQSVQSRGRKCPMSALLRSFYITRDTGSDSLHHMLMSGGRTIRGLLLSS